MSEPLTRLLDRIDARLLNSVPPDAIDRALASTPRQTAVSPLRDHEVMQRLRRELAEANVRAETVRQAFQLLDRVLGHL